MRTNTVVHPRCARKGRYETIRTQTLRHHPTSSADQISAARKVHKDLKELVSWIRLKHAYTHVTIKSMDVCDTLQGFACHTKIYGVLVIVAACLELVIRQT